MDTAWVNQCTLSCLVVSWWAVVCCGRSRRVAPASTRPPRSCRIVPPRPLPLSVRWGAVSRTTAPPLLPLAAEEEERSICGVVHFPSWEIAISKSLFYYLNVNKLILISFQWFCCSISIRQHHKVIE